MKYLTTIVFNGDFLLATHNKVAAMSHYWWFTAYACAYVYMTYVCVRVYLSIFGSKLCSRADSAV